jgi:hypothetical protein
MAGIKITEYPNTQTSFDNDDEFDVSAYQGPSLVYQTRKYTWSTLKTALLAYFGQIWPSGTNGQIMKKGASTWQATSEVHINSGNVGFGTISATSRIDAQKDIVSTGEAIANFFNTYSGSATTNIIGHVKVQGTSIGRVLKADNKYGNDNDMFIRNEDATDGNINIISEGNANFKGGINFYPEGATPNVSEKAPLQITKGGKLLWKEMVTNGFAHNQGFKIVDQISSTPLGPTGEYLQIEIKGVTRYIELYN